MQFKQKKRIISLILAVVFLSVIFGCSKPAPVSYSVMLPEGEGYRVVGEKILSVERGGMAVFHVMMVIPYGGDFARKYNCLPLYKP